MSTSSCEVPRKSDIRKCFYFGLHFYYHYMGQCIGKCFSGL